MSTFWWSAILLSAILLSAKERSAFFSLKKGRICRRFYATLFSLFSPLFASDVFFSAEKKEKIYST
jgi:hypothetical protein